MGNPQEMHHSSLHEKCSSSDGRISQTNKREHDDADNNIEINSQDLSDVPDMLLYGNGSVSKKFKKDADIMEENIIINESKSESLMERVWGKHNTVMTPEERQKFLATPPIWAPALRHVICYNNASIGHFSS